MCLNLDSVVLLTRAISGLTAASRLSEDPNVNVIVFEAGQLAEDLPEVSRRC